MTKETQATPRIWINQDQVTHVIVSGEGEEARTQVYLAGNTWLQSGERSIGGQTVITFHGEDALREVVQGTVLEYALLSKEAPRHPFSVGHTHAKGD